VARRYSDSADSLPISLARIAFRWCASRTERVLWLRFRGETVKEWMHDLRPLSPRAEQLRAELAGKIALLTGSAESRVTEIAGLTLHRRPARTAPCSMTYQASVTVIAQGRKRVELGKSVFVYDASRFLLTSVDLPVVSRIVEASQARPCLAMSLQLSVAMVIAGGGAPPRSPAMATGETTPEFLDACGRLLDLLQKPRTFRFWVG
jgi:AraC-type transcriptional regulator N-terminus